MTLLAEEVRERHREAAGVPRADQLFGVRPADALFGACTERERSLENAAANRDPAAPSGTVPLQLACAVRVILNANSAS